LNPKLLHVLEKFKIAPQIIITRDKKPGAPRDRGLKDDIIIRVTTNCHLASNRRDGCASGDQLQVLDNLFFLNAVLALNPGPPKNLCLPFTSARAAAMSVSIAVDGCF